MKKIFNLILAALVIIGAAACTKNNEANDVVLPAEGLSFYADLSMTRVDLQESNGVWNTAWEGNEILTVVAADRSASYEFVNTPAEPNKFTCTTAGVESLVGNPVVINHTPASLSLIGKQGIYVQQEVDAFDPTTAIKLTAINSFLRYDYQGAGTVTFTLVNNAEPEAGAFFVEENANVQSVTTDARGENWISFLATAEAAECTLTYSVNGIECKKTTLSITSGKVYNLGMLSDPEVTNFGVVGSFQGWDVAEGKPAQMYTSTDGWVVATGVELYKDDEIKIVEGNSWDVSYGPDGSAQVLDVDTEHTLVKGGQNIKVAKNGKYNIYFHEADAKFKYECVEEYAGLTVDITINNKAAWSPLYLVLKSGDTLLTAAGGALISGSTYAISGDYIGSSLSYQFISGDKSTDFANVTITKSGATITLEETVIKLMVQLNTDNSKQWWGNTMKIHVWNTGTSFDTSWPGTEMTSEGNYTWSINVPSELVGKTINYLVHNGNGWQSSDSTVTITAEGNTVTGSSIGID